MENNSLAAKFRRFEMLMHRAQAHSYRSFGPLGNPSRGQGRILAILKIKPEISQKELGYLLEMRNQSLGELLGKLEKSGYITRTPSEEDKRTMNIQLTEEGKNAADQIGQIQESSGTVFDSLSEEDQAKLSEILDLLIDSLSKRLDDENAPAHPFEHMRRPEGCRFEGNHPFDRDSMREFFGSMHRGPHAEEDDG